MKTTYKVLAASAAVVLLAAGALAIAAPASAQTPTPGTPTTGDQRGTRMQEFLSAVATNLGVSVDRLQQAAKDAETQMVDRALASGRLTQEQADKLKTRINAGNGFGFLRQLQARQRVRQEVARAEVIRSAAGALNMTPAELRTELKDGKSVAAVASARGVSLDAVKSAITADVKAKLDARVAAGTITQEREDALLQRLADGIDAALQRSRQPAPSSS